MGGENRIEITISANASSAKGAVADLRRELDGLGGGAGNTKSQLDSLGGGTLDAKRAMDSFGGSVGSIKSILVGLGSALAAVKISDFVKDAALAAARVETLGVVMEVVGRNAGIAKASMDATAAGLQKQGIAIVESRDATVKLTQAGIDLARATDLGRIAQDAAVIGQMNSSQAFMHLVAAIQTAQPEMLRTIGMNVNFEDSYKQLAAQTHKSAEALTEQEKMVARVGAVMESGRRISGTYEAAMGTAGKQISSFTRYMEDLKAVGGEALQEGLSGSVVMATQKVKEFTEYLKTGEAKEQIAAIGKTGEETFKSLMTAGEVVGKYLGVTLQGWNSLPPLVQEVGIVAAVVGGAKATAAIAAVSAATGAVRGLLAETTNLMNLTTDPTDAGNALIWGKANLAQDKKDLANWDSSLLTRVGHRLTKEQLQERVSWFESYVKGLDPNKIRDAEGVILNDSLATPRNTTPVIPETWGDLVARKTKILGGGGASSLSDETRTANAKRDFEARYDLSQRMYAMAQGDSAKMAEAVGVERDAHHALGVELESINAKHKKAGDAARKTSFEISEAMNKALGASDSWTGDAWSGKFRKLLADLDNDLKAAKTPIEEYWAYWEYGAKKAQATFEQWTDSIKRSGVLESQIGQLSLDPGRQLAGDRAQLAAEWQQAVKAAGENQEEILRVNELYQLKEVDLREKTLGDVAQLDDAYWDRRKVGLARMDSFLQQQGVSEQTRAAVMSQKLSKIDEDRLKARLGYEDSFIDYLKDYLAIEFKLYQDATTRERELWKEVASSTVGFIRQIGQELQTGLSDYLDALLTNDSAKREKAWGSMLQRMLADAARWAVDMAMMMAKNVVFMPIVGQFLGVEGMEGLSASVQGGQSKTSGGLLSNVKQYGGYAKDAYSAFNGGGGSIINSIDTWGYNTLGIGTAGYSSSALNAASSAFSSGGSGLTGYQALHAADAAAVKSLSASSGVTGGLGSMASAGAMSAGAGFMAGQFLRPDNNSSSITGGLAGLAGGATAAYLGAGAWAGPIGIAAGLVASAITAAITPATKTSTWGVPKASQPAVWVVDGKDVAASYGVIKTTTSGFGGSQSTSHATIYDLASSEISAEVKAGMDAAGASLKSFSKSLGQTDADFSATMKGVQSMMIAIPEGMEDVVYKNLTNLKTEHYLKQMGLIDQANGLLRAGESYIDLINRTETAAATAGAALGVVGLSLEQMSGSAERLIQGDWASKVIEVMGGADAFTGAMTRFNNWAYSGAEQATHATEYFGGKAIEALGEIQASGVTLTNFWGEYRQRMETGMMSPEEFGQWANAATWVEQAYNAAASAAEQQVQAEQTRLQAMQATRQELEQQADAWADAKQSLRDFLHSMRTDQYTTLSPTANLAERQQAYADARARAQSGDLGAQDDFRQYASDFREFAADYYGMNQDYVAIDQMIQADTTGLISAADMQLAATNEQIARLDADILVSQQILASSSLVNDNLARVAGAVESSGASIVGAINSLGASASFDGGGQAAAISSANDALLQQQALLLSFSGGSDMSNMWDGVPRFAEGGLITGGIPGVDSVPLLAMDGERILSVPQSQMLERIYAMSASGTDTSKLERLMAQVLNAVAGGNAAVAKLLAKVEQNTAVVASEMERA